MNDEHFMPVYFWILTFFFVWQARADDWQVRQINQQSSIAGFGRTMK